MAEKRENSVLFSLRELRQIEESRVQEEEHAVRSADEQRARAKADAERRARDEEEAKLRAERDHQRAMEEARVAAEREARMRVESAEATERARQQAALEQQRLQHEMELRRAEVAKKRPTWMLVVTGIAIVAAIGLVFFAIERKKAQEKADEENRIAQIEKDKAEQRMKELNAQVEKFQRDLDEMDSKVTKAVADVAAAKDASDIKLAQNRLMELQREQAEMKQRVAAAKAAAEKAERNKGLHVSKECMDNPLAKGCS